MSWLELIRGSNSYIKILENFLEIITFDKFNPLKLITRKLHNCILIKKQRVEMNTICFISGGVAELVVQKFGSYLLQVVFQRHETHQDACTAFNWPGRPYRTYSCYGFTPFSSTTFWKLTEKIPTVTDFLCFQLLRYIFP